MSPAIITTIAAIVCALCNVFIVGLLWRHDRRQSSDEPPF
jgi:hypothetical protein